MGMYDDMNDEPYEQYGFGDLPIDDSRIFMPESLEPMQLNDKTQKIPPVGSAKAAPGFNVDLVDAIEGIDY